MRLVYFTLLGFLITACSTPQIPLTQHSYESAAKLQQNNKQLTAWDLSASTSLITETSSYSLSVAWHQADDKYDLRFDAPFTTGVLKVKGYQGFSELTVENKKTIRGDNPEQLITQLTQFNIPVTGLVHWVRAIPHNNSTFDIAIQANGYTKTIKQDGWLIEYDDWSQIKIDSKQYDLPGQIKLSSGGLQIKISPSTWVKKTVETNPVFTDLNFN